MPGSRSATTSSSRATGGSTRSTRSATDLSSSSHSRSPLCRRPPRCRYPERDGPPDASPAGGRRAPRADGALDLRDGPRRPGGGPSERAPARPLRHRGDRMPPDSSTGWMPQSNVPWDYAYQYLAGGVNTGGGWRTWNEKAQFPLWYAKGAAGNGYN